MTGWLIGSLAACRPPAAPPLPTFPDATGATGTTAETGGPPTPPTPTGSTGDTAGEYPPWTVTWDKESWPDWAKYDVIPPLSADVFVPPSVRVVGYPDAGIAVAAGGVIPAYGADPGAIFVGGGAYSTDVDHPYAYILSGGLARGEYTLYDAWDGLSGSYVVSTYEMGEIGDVDGDGHLDFWNETNLFLGPVLGRGYPPYWVHDGAAAWIEDGWGFHHMPGRYDADGDGVNDVVFGIGTTGFLAFGPFEGQIDLPWYAPTPEGFVVFGEQWCSDNTGAYPTLLRDQLGPGHHAVAIGQCSSGYEATRIYDLEGPRDRFVPIDDALAVVGNDSGVLPLFDPGDLTGDGIGDLEISGISYVAGPVSGYPKYAPPILTTDIGWFPGSSVGDMNGDGVTEILAVDLLSGAYVLLFSPHPNPVDLAQGLPIGVGPYEISSLFFRPPSDVDGDGLTDIVYGYPPLPPDNRGEVRIWFGADLVAAHAARQRSRAPTPPNRSEP